MRLESVTTSALCIPFRSAFRHASAERAVTQALWGEARSNDGTVGYGEGCPREYVTGENIDSALRFVSLHAPDLRRSVCDVASLHEWVVRHAADIDGNPAAWTAVEIAILDLLGKLEGETVENLLGEPVLSGVFRYTAVIGDATPEEFSAQLGKYLKAGFHDFKIKLSGEAGRDLAKVRALVAAGIPPQSVRADANNLWPDGGAAIAALGALDYPFFALEEPLHAGDYAGMRLIADALGVKIILDESLLRIGQLDDLGSLQASCIANLRVSKMGGVMRSMEMVNELRRRGMPVIIGAHVGESSVLTRAALTVANGARDLLAAQEGAFGTYLLAHDVVDPPLMFGAGGVLDVAAAALDGPGWGLAITVR
ncbi:MAG: mandelate racemase/muconate lactonizing enzyme family protein [Burkholderiales bacterium]